MLAVILGAATFNTTNLLMSEHYQVLARKYRPHTFSEMVGQTHTVKTLINALDADSLHHGFLFTGTRGVGKTTCARIFAKTINCQNPTSEGEPCNECDSCKAFNENASFNIHELDAASNNSVDGIRALVEQVRIPPQAGKYKVYIIDEVHMLSSSAFVSTLLIASLAAAWSSGRIVVYIFNPPEYSILFPNFFATFSFT